MQAIASCDVELPSIDIHYRRCGLEGAPALVMLHGFMQDSSVWDESMIHLADRFLVHAPDIVGHGKTRCPIPSEHYHLDRMVEDLHRMAVELRLAPFHLVGYSMGGRIALLYALAYPETLLSLVLVSSSLGPKDEPTGVAMRKRDMLWAASLRNGCMEAFVDSWERLPIFSTQRLLAAPVRERVRAMRIGNDPLAMAAIIEGAGQGSMPSLEAEVESLAVPFVYMAGKDDEKYARIADGLACRGIEAETLPCGHDVRLECPDGFLNALDRFYGRMAVCSTHMKGEKRGA